MNLRFPLLSGGVTQGLNDAGIETFEGDYAHYVVRECIQNSLDAAASPDDPVKVEIALHSVSADELPFIEDLRTTLARCEGAWRNHDGPREFFRRASQVSRSQTISLLRISDYGTTGVPGDDDNDTQPWFGLVRSRGVSIKADEDSGGAFGIGKDAPLAASAVRTVLYSTRTAGGDVALQGICRLATHEVDGEKTQGTGFIGLCDERAARFLALRNPEAIPERFRREVPGLDVWIVGASFSPDQWETPFVAAALRNFWPAIYFGRLSVRVGTKIIDKATLPELMHQYGREEAVEEALPFYEAVTAAGSHRVDDSLAEAGSCSLHVSIGRRDLPRRICMTRKTGMVIFNYAPRTIRVPFAGLFCCNDHRGNTLLKALEPPSHDEWAAKRARTGSQREILREIKEWIRAKLTGLIPDIDREVINEDSIADLLPDDLPGPADFAGDDTDLGGKPSAPRVAAQPQPVVPAVRSLEGELNARGQDPGRGGSGTGDTTSPEGGDGTNTGGRMGRTGGSQPPGGGAVGATPRIELRSYRRADGAYQLIARSDSVHEGSLRIDALTEDGAAVSCPLVSARDESGNELVVRENRIFGVSLQPGRPLRLAVVLAAPMRLALRATTL